MHDVHLRIWLTWQHVAKLVWLTGERCDAGTAMCCLAKARESHVGVYSEERVRSGCGSTRGHISADAGCRRKTHNRHAAGTCRPVGTNHCQTTDINQRAPSLSQSQEICRSNGLNNCQGQIRQAKRKMRLIWVIHLTEMQAVGGKCLKFSCEFVKFQDVSTIYHLEVGNFRYSYNFRRGPGVPPDLFYSMLVTGNS